MGDKFVYHETVLHGSEAFPVSMALVRCNGCGDGDMNRHDELQLIFMRSGEAVFQVDITSYPVRAGDTLLIRSGALHSRAPLCARSCEYYIMLVNYRILFSDGMDIIRTHYLEPFMQGNFNLPVFIGSRSDWEQEALHWIAKAFMALKTKGTAYQLATKAYLYRFLFILFSSGMHSDGGTGGNEERLQNVLAYIRVNFYKKIQLAELARIVSMTPEYFCEFFKKYVQETPVEYINRCRIQKARRLLAETDLSVADIASQVGFSSAAYFSRVFKAYAGTAPMCYRRNNPVERKPFREDSGPVPSRLPEE